MPIICPNNPEVWGGLQIILMLPIEWEAVCTCMYMSMFDNYEDRLRQKPTIARKRELTGKHHHDVACLYSWDLKQQYVSNSPPARTAK